MPTLTQRISLATLIAPSGRCVKCRCGSYLTTRQERTDGLCLYCAAQPACSAAFAMAELPRNRFDR